MIIDILQWIVILGLGYYIKYLQNTINKLLDTWNQFIKDLEE